MFGPPASPDLEAWVLASAPRAVAYARSLLGNKDAAEDIVQDCYGRLIAKAHQYDLIRDGTKLLMASISNACINATMRRKPVVSLATITAGEESSYDPPDRTTASADEVASGNELEKAMASAMAELPVMQRAAVELKALGHSQQEIGEMLKTTASNAGVLIHRARQTLAKRLAPFLEGDDSQ